MVSLRLLLLSKLAVPTVISGSTMTHRFGLATWSQLFLELLVTFRTNSDAISSDGEKKRTRRNKKKEKSDGRMSSNTSHSERHYRINELSKLWRLGRETIRLIIKDQPDVLKIRMGRKRANTIYSVPESAAQRIHTRLLSGGS
jgi:hypothetical protein